MMDLHAAEVELIGPDPNRLTFVVNNSTVPISIGLARALPASTTWILDGLLSYNTTPTAGCKVALSVPPGAQYQLDETGGTLRGVLVMGATPGVVSVLAAQDTAESSNTVFHADVSWVRFSQWPDEPE